MVIVDNGMLVVNNFLVFMWNEGSYYSMTMVKLIECKIDQAE